MPINFVESITVASSVCLFFFNDPATTEIYTLSLHDALPIGGPADRPGGRAVRAPRGPAALARRSEEHTSELQSHLNLVCRLLLEKNKNKRGGEEQQKKKNIDQYKPISH